jgi:uncharacterized protein YjbI with pentapeptide repeats
MAAFTRLALIALSGMTGRLMRRKRSRTSEEKPVRARKTLTTRTGEPAQRPQDTPPATASTTVETAAATPPPPVDHFRQLSPRSGAPPIASIAAKSLPILGLLGTAATVTLAIGMFNGEPLPYIGPIENSTPVLAVAMLTISIWAVYLLWKVPQWQAAAWAKSSNASPRELFEIENDSRSTLGQILSGVAVLTGLIFAWQQLGTTSDNLRVSQEGQITDRFSRAVDQLGSDNLSIRLGGIYSLERIARDSPRDYGPVMEVLTAFVRQNAPVAANAAATPVTAVPRVAPDIRAVLKVIGRRTPAQVDVEIEEGADCLDLTGVSLVGVNLVDTNLRNTCWDRSDLRAAQLSRANLTNTTFSGTDLSQQANLQDANAAGAIFNDANLALSNLTNTDFTNANLQAANLSQAILDRTIFINANLVRANLEGARIIGTNLSGASVFNANFAGALLIGADLAGAEDLTGEQLQGAIIDGNTLLPEGVAASPVP